MLFLFPDEPRAERHPGEHAAIGDFGSLGEPLVGPILVQADATLPTIIAADRTHAICGVPNHGSPFEPQRTGAPIGLAHAPLRRLQAVQLPPMQAGSYHVPQAGTRGLGRPTDRCRQDPRINGVRVKGLLGLALGLLESVLLSQLLCLVSLAEMNRETHLTEQAIQVLFPDLDRAKRPVPLAPFALAGHSLHILNHHSGEWKHFLQLSNHPRFGFPATSGRRRHPLLAVEAIVKALGSSPFAMSSCSSHGSPRFDSFFDVIGCLCHETEHGILGANHTEALKLASWVYAHSQRLIVWLLLIGQLHIEQAKFVSLWSRLATLEEVASFHGRTGHELYPACIHHCYSHKDCLSPCPGTGDMTLPDGPTGLAIVPIDSVSFGVARSGPR